MAIERHWIVQPVICVHSRVSAQSFVLLMLLASSAFAAELSLQQQLDAVQTELAASRAHNKQLLSENERLKNEKIMGLDGGAQVHIGALCMLSPRPG